MSDAPLRSPLHDATARAGATTVPFGGWEMPLRFGSELDEHRAVRTAAGLFDLSHMAQIHVTGPGAGHLLDRALVTRPSTTEVGRARYSLLLAQDGGILDDLVVYRIGQEEHLVVANAANRVLVVGELTARGDGLPASVDDRTRSRALLAVQGPASAPLLEHLDHRVAGLRHYRVVPATLAGIDVLLARTGYTGEHGYEIMLPAAHSERLWDTILREGAPRGLVPAGLAARDSLRLEAALPLYGNELSRTTNPDEVGLGRLVDLDEEHAFVGRAAVLALRERPTGRTLIAIGGEGRRAARAGSTVLVDGDAVGAVTSGQLSPTLGRPIALALVDRPVAVGRPVEVDVRGRRMPMTVVDRPFYRRPA